MPSGAHIGESEMSNDVERLEEVVRRIDGRGYKAYRDLKRTWDFGDFVLTVDHVQSDPFAAPSRLHVDVSAEVCGFDTALLSSRSRRIGVACRLARAFQAAARARARPRGTGRSGEVRIEAPGQEVLDQTAVILAEQGSLEARFTAGLPARGRRIDGSAAVELLTRILPAVVRSSLLSSAHEPHDLLTHAEVNEDADHLRGLLQAHGLIAFIANGSVLPRLSGVDDRPLIGDTVVPFESPTSLTTTLERPNAGPVEGMGIEEGVTLIVGGGYHGKSTVLRAIDAGVYNHRPGDGRELVVSRTDTVRIRAEDGRSVTGVDISPFIGGLPGGRDTRFFHTANASGSTSQAAAIVEAIEVGARALLIDEDTAATNFMIRDRRMQALVPKAEEPISPLVDRVRGLAEERGVSTILVLGGSGDYLEMADTVVSMNGYRPKDVAARAREVAEQWPTGRLRESPGELPPPTERVPDPSSVDPSHGRREVRLKVRGTKTVEFGGSEIDVSALGPIVSRAQLHTIARALVLARNRFMDGRTPLAEVLDSVESVVEEHGLDALDSGRAGDLTSFRRFELAGALNRLRTLRITPGTAEVTP